MPLNPEEVVNKRFSATKFRQGYDEEEVDEFLDEVVTELRRLNAENTDLRSKLSTCEGRVTELTSQLADQPSGASSVTRSAPVVAAAPAPEPTPAPEPVVPAAAPAAAAPVTTGTDGVAGMLALAQKLHDEHVAEGRAQGQQILAEAQEQAARLVNEAETTSRETLGTLETQRRELETEVEQLRGFEREYRSRLKSYLESQLRELDQAGSATSATAGSGDAATPRAPFGG